MNLYRCAIKCNSRCDALEARNYFAVSIIFDINHFHKNRYIMSLQNVFMFYFRSCLYILISACLTSNKLSKVAGLQFDTPDGCFVYIRIITDAEIKIVICAI